MIRVKGKPFLEYQLNLLSASGIKDFVLCVGYLGKTIQDYFGDGAKFGIKLEYSFDGDKPLGVVGALKRAEPLLQDVFFATYGDAYLLADYSSTFRDFTKRQKLAMMLVYENHNLRGKSDLVVKDGFVTTYDKRNQTADMVWINYGVSLLRKEALQYIPENRKYGEEEFYGDLIKRKELLAKVVSTRFYEIGTPSALKEFEAFFSKIE
jgi:NDP-sugar pyrophosphorylase family protein